MAVHPQISKSKGIGVVEGIFGLAMADFAGTEEGHTDTLGLESLFLVPELAVELKEVKTCMAIVSRSFEFSLGLAIAVRGEFAECLYLDGAVDAEGVAVDHVA